MMNMKNNRGFTLIEVLIAITIFGLLMLYITQFMRMEFRLYDQALEQNEVNQKARVVMMHLLDEVRFVGKAAYVPAGSPHVSGSRFYEDSAGNALLDITPGQTPPDEYLYFNRDNHTLYLRQDSSPGQEYAIADGIEIELAQVSDLLLEIEVRSLAEDSGADYTLVSWIRLN